MGLVFSKRELVGLIAGVAILQVISASLDCLKNQTARLDREGYVSCNFPDNFRAIYWFDDVSDGSHYAIKLNGRNGIKTGPGVQSGKYDVLQNGSLIISNVSAWHQRMYRVVVSSDITPYIQLIFLHVIAPPRDQNPAITCNHCFDGYYINVKGSCTLHCSFNVARPEVQLEWMKASYDGSLHTPIYQQTSLTENENGTYNSLASVHLSQDGEHLITFLVCRASWFPLKWQKENQIIVDNSQKKFFTSLPYNSLYMEINKQATVFCGRYTSAYYVWKKMPTIGGPEIIGFHSHHLKKKISNIQDVEVSADGSLIFASPQVHHEGIYACVYGDDQQEDIQMTSVQILIPPSPPYLHILGCENVSRKCHLKESNTKKLTCAVYGVRPAASIEWIAEAEDQISFFNYNEILKQRGSAYDVILSVEYSISEGVSCGMEIKVNCFLHGPVSKITKNDSAIFIDPEFCVTMEERESIVQLLALIVVLLALALILAIIIPIHGFQARKKRKQVGQYESVNQIYFRASKSKIAGQDETLAIAE